MLFKRRGLRRNLVLFVLFVVVFVLAFYTIDPEWFDRSKVDEPTVAEGNTIKEESALEMQESESTEDVAVYAPAISVSVAPVETYFLEIYQNTIGVVENSHQSEVSSEAYGIIKELYVDIGDTIYQGQLLALVDQREFLNTLDLRASELRSLESEYQELKKELERNMKLHGNGFVSEADIDKLKTQVLVMEEQILRGKTNLDQIVLQISKTEIKAPKSGILQTKLVSEGDYVSIGKPMFKIVDNNNLLVIAWIPEQYGSMIVKGQKVILSQRYSDIFVESTVKEISPIINSETRSMQLIVDVPVGSLPHLRSGGTVNLDILVDVKPNAIMIAESSIVMKSRGYVVYLLQSDSNKVVEIPVETGVSKDSRIEILSGLSIGDMIVVEGAGFVSNNSRVAIK